MARDSEIAMARDQFVNIRTSGESGVYGAEQLEALQAKLMRWSVTGPKELEKTLRIGAEMVRKEAQLHHLSGPKMPRGVGGGWNWAVGKGFGASQSVTGNATLGVVTGLLRRSIAMRVSVKPGAIEAMVGTSVWYGRLHEFGNKTWSIGKGFGSGHMPARPWLRPSLQHEHKAIFEMIDKAWFNAYGK